jgi:hypothetical protein
MDLEGAIRMTLHLPKPIADCFFRLEGDRISSLEIKP